MSIIGTRPPLISETNFYELHHRAIRIYSIDEMFSAVIAASTVSHC